MKFNKKLTTTLLAALILTSATNAQAMGWSFTTGWKKWALFGAVTAVAALVIKRMWATPHIAPAPQPVPAINNQANALGQELRHAAVTGDHARVQDLIAAGADVNAQNNNGNTALMLAAYRGHTEIAQALIAAGADLNAQDQNGGTPLIYAARLDHTEIAQALIAAGADVNTQNNNGNTALMLAADRGHTETVRVLIAAGADVNTHNNDGYTALICAAIHGHTETVRVLIAAGADLNAKKEWGETALILAAKNGRTETAQALIELGAHLEAKALRGQTALITAAQHGHIEIAQALIAAGANINAQGGLCGTALITAAKRGHREIAQALIAAGANINAQDYLNRTALNIAAYSGRTQIAQALLAAGADVNTRDCNRYTALISATLNDHHDTVDLITQEQNRTSTPLHHACSYGIGSENIELVLRDAQKRRAIETMYADLNNLPAGTMTPRIEELLHGENANLDVVNTNGYTARHYLQTRAWMMLPTTITIRTLTGNTLTFNCTRGTQIHALKRLIAQQLSTPAQPVNTSRITLTRNNNLARATDYEVAGITTEFHMVIGDTQQHNPGRAQAGPANA